MSGMVHTGVKVYRIDSEMSRLVEQPWLQLVCCAVCHMVATLDEGKKVQVGVSTDWCVAVEHRRSSSIRDYLHRLSD